MTGLGKAWDAARQALGYLWWSIQVHAIGIWRKGPLGYYRMRRDLRRALDLIVAQCPGTERLLEIDPDILAAVFPESDPEEPRP